MSKHSLVDDTDEQDTRNVRTKGAGHQTPWFSDTTRTNTDGDNNEEKNDMQLTPRCDDNIVEVLDPSGAEGLGLYLEYLSSRSLSNSHSNSSRKQSNDQIVGKTPTPTRASARNDPFVIGNNTVQNLRRRYNTTSTIHAASTIAHPHCEQILFCLASVLQAQICEDLSLLRNSSAAASLSVDASAFDYVPELAPEYGGPQQEVPQHILNQETAGDDLLRKEIKDGFVPTIDNIYRYISMFFRGAGYSPECNIIALVFINRITTSHKLPLTMSNWRSLWLVTVILAQKVWDDKPLRTSAFTTILPTFPKKQLRDMEAKALNLLQYFTSVKPSLYAKYYFELRELFTEIMGFRDEEWNIKPLSVVGFKKLEHRAKTYREKNEKKIRKNTNDAKASHVSSTEKESSGKRARVKKRSKASNDAWSDDESDDSDPKPSGELPTVAEEKACGDEHGDLASTAGPEALMNLAQQKAPASVDVELKGHKSTVTDVGTSLNYSPGLPDSILQTDLALSDHGGSCSVQQSTGSASGSASTSSSAVGKRAKTSATLEDVTRSITTLYVIS